MPQKMILLSGELVIARFITLYITWRIKCLMLLSSRVKSGSSSIMQRKFPTEDKPDGNRI